MQGENYQDGYSTRVRHVPIQIESRGPSTRGHHQRQSEEQVNDQTSRFINDPSYRQMRGNPQNVHQNERSYSPSNTSTINIDYEPPAPQRRPNTNYQAEGNLNRTNNRESSPNLSSQRDEEIPSHGTTPHTASKDKKRQPSNNPSPQQSDKLVGSPEPIPLPPPPADQQQNQHLKDNNNKQESKQKQKQESSRDRLSSDNKKENYSFTEREGPQQNVENQGQKSPQGSDKDTSVMGKINSVKEEVTKLLQEITKFSEISAKSKEYRYLDEMLTRCVLKLDNVECGDVAELRHQRKAAVKLVDRATDILQRKLQINSDIHDLSQSMTVPS